MIDKINLLKEILILSLNNQLLWESDDYYSSDTPSYSCYDTYKSNPLSVNINFYDERISVWVIIGDEIYRYYAFISASKTTTDEELFIHSLVNIVQLKFHCKKLEEKASTDFGDEETSPSIILDILLKTSHQKIKWTKKLVSNLDFYDTDDLHIKKYIDHASDISKFQAVWNNDVFGVSESCNLYYFRYDNSQIPGEACVLEIIDVEGKYASYADVNYDTKYGTKGNLLFKLYNTVLVNYFYDESSSFEQTIGKIKELVTFAQSRKNVVAVEEILSFFPNFDKKQLLKIIQYLEKNNIDVLQVPSIDEIEAEPKVQHSLNPQHVPINKYATEEERIAARKASQKKYRQKQNKTNEYKTNKTLDIANSNPYAKYEDDMILLHKISKK